MKNNIELLCFCVIEIWCESWTMDKSFGLQESNIFWIVLLLKPSQKSKKCKGCRKRASVMETLHNRMWLRLMQDMYLEDSSDTDAILILEGIIEH